MANDADDAAGWTELDLLDALPYEPTVVTRKPMPSKDTLIEYARLLRRAWLNPHHEASLLAVCGFERAHPELCDLFVKWQKTEPDFFDA